MAAINISEKSIVNEVFRFVSIRNPERSSSLQQQHGVVQHRASYGGAFFQTLTDIRNDATLDTQAQRTALSAAAKAYLAGPDAILDAAEIKEAVGELPALYPWIKAHATTLQPGELETEWPGVGGLSDLGKGRLWDNFMAMLIAGGLSTLRESILEALLAQHFLDHYQREDGLQPQAVLDALAAAHVALPASVFPLPIPAQEAQAPEPVTEPEKSSAMADWRAIQRLLPALEAERERRISAWRFQQPVLDENNEPVLPPLDLGYTKPFVQALGEEVEDLLARLQLPVGTDIGHAIEVLTRTAAGLEGTLAAAGTPGRKVVLYAGAIWNTEAEAAANDAVQRVTTPDGNDPQWTDWQAKQEAPGAQNTCGVRPLGVADLKKVEQKLCCYAPGEVAHIENILQGEYKERSTRRLKRREETYGTITEREKVDERDSVSTERYELSKETSQLLQKDTSLAVGVNTSYYGPVNIMVDAQFATSNSSTQSDSLSNNYAKEVTERAVQRIVERVREEHYLTLVEEFEENNKHGLDNRAGTQHVVGLYRWADKIYEAKIVNYGKRLMMEFMVPEPAHFHTWAMSQPDASAATKLTEPFHPGSLEAQAAVGTTAPLRKAEDLNPWNYQRWAGAYGAKVNPAPKMLRVNKSYGESNQDKDKYFSKNYDDFQLPDGYKATLARLSTFQRSNPYQDAALWVMLGPHLLFFSHNNTNGSAAAGQPIPLSGESGFLSVVVSGKAEAYGINLVVECYPTDMTYQKWQNDTFEAIMTAFQLKKDAFDQAMNNAMAGRSSAIRGSNPAILRSLEQAELKKGCLEWLFKGQEFGHDGITEANPLIPCGVPTTQPNCLTQRAGERAKFMEHAFEWRHMTYDFYPYYWAGRCRWKQLYRYENADPLFLNFLQAGMARVLVPVRPGSEKAVLFYLQTGQIWNGGLIPTLDMDLYNDYVRDLDTPAKNDSTQTWEIRIPTSLTVLQCESGCIEGSGLPCECADGVGKHSAPLVGLGVESSGTGSEADPGGGS